MNRKTDRLLAKLRRAMPSENERSEFLRSKNEVSVEFLRSKNEVSVEFLRDKKLSLPCGQNGQGGVLSNENSVLPAVRAIEVGLSGGLDSVVLLFLLKTLCREWGVQLSAVHVHHGLQAAADGWVDFCRDLCAQWNIPLRTVYADVEPSGQGVEAAARQARYAAFADSRADAVALAHHADDQTETFFLAALRGGGLRALSAMPVLRRLKNGSADYRAEAECSDENGGADSADDERETAHGVWLWRPLLAFSRQDLAECATENGLPFIEDPMNAAPELLRGWLRHYGLPAWRERLPALDKHLGSSIALLQDELAVLQESVSDGLAEIEAAGFFDCTVWRGFSAARRKMLLLRWAEQQGLGTPNRRSLADFAETLYRLDNGSAQWTLSHGEIQAYQNRLFALPKGWEKQFSQLQGRLNTADGCGLPQAFIRTVRADDVLAIKNGRKNVMKLLQEYRILPFARPLWPVLDDGSGHCIAVCNLRAAEGFSAQILPVSGSLQPFIVGKKERPAN